MATRSFPRAHGVCAPRPVLTRTNAPHPAGKVAQVTTEPDDLPASERFLDDHPDGVTPQLVGLIARARVRSTRP